MNQKNKIAILYICTGQYIAFWQDFYQSFEENFLRKAELHYYVFTDSDNVCGADANPRVHQIYQENLGWPGNTLFRFRIFLTMEEELKQYDYIFFMNANVLCKREVKEEEILPGKDELLVVLHPGYFNQKPYQYNYERNKRSLAYIPYSKGKVYVCGGINGGSADTYLKMVHTLRDQIDEDYSKGIIAVWHDESHLNKYILENSSYRLLTPSFCYPEEKDNLPFEPVLVVQDKKRYIQLDSNKINELKVENPLYKRVLRRARNMFWGVYYALQ